VKAFWLASQKAKSRFSIVECISVVILCGLALPAALAQGTGNDWLRGHLLNPSSELPFSFIYGRQSSAALLHSWTKKTTTREVDAGTTEHTIVWTDPKTDLRVRVIATEYAGSPIVEWTQYFKNEGTSDSPILEDVQPLDLLVPLNGSGIPTIVYSNGCGGMDTYALQRHPLNQLERLHLSNQGGGKTMATIPFFDIQTKSGGLIGALGWAGQWSISMSRPTEAALSVSAGMAETHLALHPGEEIRTPLVLLFPWKGDAMDAHNLLRRHILAHHTPQYNHQPVVLPVSHSGWGGMKTSTSLRLLDQITKENIGYENFWMDAGWYGADRPVEEFQVFGREDWFLYAGDWRINRIPHPDGLRPISDAVHARGMKFLLWFEPERAVVGTPLTLSHPDWFLGEDSGNFAGNDARPFVKWRLFDFGNPAARRYMIDSMSDLITKEGIDIFRQDCNFALAPFWSQTESADRQGIAQIRYVEGLLAFWDELRRRHPNLILDIVQRGDLDTITRGVDLSRADYPVSPDADPIGNQSATQGLSYWRPVYGTMQQTRARDTYHFRSGFAPGLAFALFNGAGTNDQVGRFIPDDFPFDWIRTQVEMLKRVRPFYNGDYYPLSPCSINMDCAPNQKENSAAFEWAAWQFNRPEQGDGMVQAFRREKCDDEARDFRLRGLVATAGYEVTDLDGGPAKIVSGKDLMETGLHIDVAAKPGAAILLYKKKSPL
jgi:alpha-galactosidase